MKDKLILIAIFSVFMSILPLFASASGAEDRGDNGADASPPQTQNGGQAGDRFMGEDDVIFSVFNTVTGEAMELAGREYITHVVAAEMPASFNEEALKAQAVAAFTYAVNRKSRGTNADHEGCELCTDSTHCKAYADTARLKELWGENYETYYAKISNAVNQVYGEYMSYDGQPISAVFHSLSSGITESAENVWGHEYPYLVSVDSSGDKSIKGYETTVTLTEKEVKNIMKSYSSKCSFEADPDEWMTEVTRSDAGGVLTIKICGVTVTGGKARELFGLRSANFYSDYSTADKQFTFTVHGYGHGVGMSQYGANIMAKDGSTYDQILLHYYTGVKLESAVKGIGKFS